MEHYLIPFERISCISPYFLFLSLPRNSSSIASISSNCTCQYDGIHDERVGMIKSWDPDVYYGKM